METRKRRVRRVATIPLLALRGLVVFPQEALHFDVARHKSMQALELAMSTDQLIFLVTQKDMRVSDPQLHQLHRIGVVARIRQILKLPGDAVRVMVEGVYRARRETLIQEEPFFVVQTRECLDIPSDDPVEEQALVRECRRVFEQYAGYSPKIPADMPAQVASLDQAGILADYITANIVITAEQKQTILACLRTRTRLEALIGVLMNECAILSLEADIHDRVQEQIDHNQREYYLREQLRAIAKELGEGDNPLEEADAYRQQIESLSLPEESRDKLLGECQKLMKMPPGSQEATVIRGYLETCLALPWNHTSEDRLDLALARRILDRDHYGLEAVKDRIVELLAVRKLSPHMAGQIVCLAGPPGVGKTSIAKSLAEAMGRTYVRVSLGGTRDEADIRGHRKTYVGAMPGRIVTALKQAGTMNPVILLDEIDKLASDFRGDPAAALLEVLDSEQNGAFRDHYLEIPVDLSQVLFITTANDTGNIPGPLFDRLEIITLSSYTAEEKFHIAKEHLLKKQRQRHGLTARQMPVSDAALRLLIEGYTREAGVRELDRRLTALCRKTARHLLEQKRRTVPITPALLEQFLGPRKYRREAVAANDAVGVVTGLAWTAVGGETMPVEVAVLEGTGKLELTGSLGDIMKESARTAISFVRSRAQELNIDHAFYKRKDIHIHVPEGAVPKDGPSAGVTMATAMVSALTGMAVRRDVAMTGEITLRGRVLPIGGLKEKAMAAYNYGVKTVIIPAENAPDLAKLDPAVKDGLRFVLAEHVDEVLSEALVHLPARSGETDHTVPTSHTTHSVTMTQ